MLGKWSNYRFLSEISMKIIINIPLILTVARICIVPFLVLAILQHAWSKALILLFFAGLTDLFDGAMARWLGQESAFGAALDPVADKLLVVACYGALVSIDSPYFYIPHWFILLVVMRELIILLGAGYWGLKKRLVPIAPTWLGKSTTVLQLFFIGFLLFSSCYQVAFPHMFEFFLVTVAVAVVSSLVQYGYKAMQKVNV
jgi:cardiolipin synthase (CMP-forming)